MYPGRMSSARNVNDRRIFGFLREIRAACQYWQGLIGETLARAASVAPAGRVAFVHKALSDREFKRVEHEIEPHLHGIRDIFRTDAEEFEWCSDFVVRIELTWAHVEELWSTLSSGTFDEMESTLQEIERKLDEIVYCCASLSFSPRLNTMMSNLRTGQALDIEFQFGDEFPKNPELRKRLVLELAQESAVLDCGVVDADKGVVYKAAAARREQVASAWHLVGWLLAGFAMPVVLAGGGRVLASWPLKWGDLERLLVDYALILVGSGAHLAIAALKSDKATARPSFLPLTDWVLWLHVRESQVRKGILYVWMGYILLAFGVPNLDWSAAFFAGYSIDSVTELFLGRFQSLAKAKTAALGEGSK
jgi:hypothetical protein